MNHKRLLVAVLTLLAITGSLVPGCSYTPGGKTSYTAVIPEVFHPGATETLSLALFNLERPAREQVEVTLLDGTSVLAKTSVEVNGKAVIPVNVPDIGNGDYEIQVKGTTFEAKTPIKVEKSFLCFLETDKPIYKPGQTVYGRLITLNSELLPVSENVGVEILDAKGIKIFRSQVDTDDFGLASFELPLSSEPNLGMWKITAECENLKTQIDVRVEKYVLPKYEVKVDTGRDWFLVSDVITGTVSAEYSFGKPVNGELEIVASRYVGEWEEYASFTAAIDGQADFELPAVGYVAGVPSAGGQGNVILDVTVREPSTGYEETVSELITVAENPLNIQIIPEGSAFKPGLPFKFLVVTGSPSGETLEADISATVTYLDESYGELSSQQLEFHTTGGKAFVEISPPSGGVALTMECFELTTVSSRPPASATRVLEATYSPSGNFIHVEQSTGGLVKVGDDIGFKVYSTSEATNFYYEVISRGKVVFSDYTRGTSIGFSTSPLMAPSSRLVVYQVLPNSEVAADYLPFDVESSYPLNLDVNFTGGQAEPGDTAQLDIQTEGEARVGIAAVDKSVFILAENRLNLEQVFAELERLYMTPQVEPHEATIYPSIFTDGAQDVFKEAGVVVLSSNQLPEGKEYQAENQPGFWDGIWKFFGGREEAMDDAGAVPPQASPTQSNNLAEVERMRQYFPETWLWDTVTTGPDGKLTLDVTVPDSITTWMLRAVAVSRENGLGIDEAELVAFQPFFLSVDLPYSGIRGEEFPVRVAVYNYLQESQEVQVEIVEDGWFELLDNSNKTVSVGPGEVGGVEFMIRPTGLGLQNEIKVTARSSQAADGVIKQLMVEPEGLARELVDNLVLSPDTELNIDTSIPEPVVEGSARAYLAVTSSFLTQTIEGLEGLIQMPFGCGEQNMIVFAPDVYVTKYLEESGQLKPEILAKAEKLMITGYQRELTYMHSDGSFSAFGESDEEGSLWLTAFVLKSFSQARDLIYIDADILSGASEWIASHQNSDGSFESVGFVHHQEMLGGADGKDALTAYTAIALLEAGEEAAAGKAVGYLEDRLESMDDAYTLAITSYLFELYGSNNSQAAVQKLLEMAVRDEDGLHWQSGTDESETPGPMDIRPEMPVDMIRPAADIETTGYALMALALSGNNLDASAAAGWLVSRRNAYGGYGSTQDTVIALQALTSLSSAGRSDVNLNIEIQAGEESYNLVINNNNFDILQIVEVPVGQPVTVTSTGQGKAMAQVVKRFNVAGAEQTEADIMTVSVDYDTTSVEVNDLITVSARVKFVPPLDMEAGMVVLDVAVPTGFVPIEESVASVVDSMKNIKRYEIAGRKVIFYIENMLPGDEVLLRFQIKAQYPVKAKGVSSSAYSYYQPEIKGEVLGPEMSITA